MPEQPNQEDLGGVESARVELFDHLSEQLVKQFPGAALSVYDISIMDAETLEKIDRIEYLRDRMRRQRAHAFMTVEPEEVSPWIPNFQSSEEQPVNSENEPTSEAIRKAGGYIMKGSMLFVAGSMYGFAVKDYTQAFKAGAIGVGLFTIGYSLKND